MDAAKAIAAEAAQEGWIRSQDRPGQPTEVPDRVLPIIALPTTAGTGSEVLPFAVITFPETQRKLVLNHEALYPRHALLDPVLLVSTPRDAQVAAGMDALTHAIESYVSREATAQSRERALAAIDGQFTDQPLLKARLLQTLASTLRELGLLDDASKPQEEALSIHRRLLGDDDPATLNSINEMGRLLHEHHIQIGCLGVNRGGHPRRTCTDYQYGIVWVGSLNHSFPPLTDLLLL